MIKYNLICENNHEFESWFANSKEFEKLNKRKLLECIFCSSKTINKSIMAPMVSIAKENNEELKIYESSLKKEKEKLINIRKYIEKNFEYVGENFSKKVREIYYDKKEKNNLWNYITGRKKRIERGRY